MLGFLQFVDFSSVFKIISVGIGIVWLGLVLVYFRTISEAILVRIRKFVE